MKKFFTEFKKFIARGNVMDMAVGVIVGSAFTAIVTALTNGILKPIINWLISLCTNSSGLENVYTILKPNYVADANGEMVLDLSSSIYIDWGSLISSIINFFLIAFILFLILKAFNAAKSLESNMISIEKHIEYKQKHNKKLNKKEEAYLAKKEADAKAKAEEEAKAKEEASKPSSTDLLLMEIRDTLKNNK